MRTLLSETGVILHADNCTYLRACDNLEDSIPAVNSDFQYLANWYNGYCLSLNRSKTKAMIFHSGPSYHLSPSVLQVVTFNLYQVSEFQSWNFTPGCSRIIILICFHPIFALP